MVATAALQLVAVRLRIRWRGRGQQQWVVVALDEGFIRSLILIQTDSGMVQTWVGHFVTPLKRR